MKKKIGIYDILCTSRTRSDIKSEYPIATKGMMVVLSFIINQSRNEMLRPDFFQVMVQIPFVRAIDIYSH